MPNVLVPDRETLDFLIARGLDAQGPGADFNDLDVSNVDDLSFLFSGKSFCGDVSRWDTSNVTTMRAMFYNSRFEGDVSRWNVDRVEDMNMMFEGSFFHGDVGSWDVRSVKDFRSMFKGSFFDGDLSRWQVRADAETSFMLANLPQLLTRESGLLLPVIPLKEDLEALFGYNPPAYQAWLTQRPIDANHWRVLMQAVESSEKDTWLWESMDASLWPHADMLDAWTRMRPVHQGLGLTFLESAQWMMGNTPTCASHSPSLEGMFA